MKNKKIAGMLLVLVLAFVLVPGASAYPTKNEACQNCHSTGGTLSITNVAIASTTVNPGQVFNADITWTGGSSGSTTVKWPSVVVNNNLFTFVPVQRDYTVTSGTSSFAITAPSTPGTYTIRVYAATGPNPMETDYRDIAITVKAPQSRVLTTVTISPLTPTVQTPNTLQFSAVALDQNKAAIGAALTWSSSDPTKGTINSATGLFSAVSQGTTTITVTAVNGSTTVTNSTIVTVTVPAQVKVLTTVTISPLTPTVQTPNTLQFSAVALDQNKAAIGATLTWSSSDPANGTINSTTGLFKAVTPGTTTITVTAVNGSTTVTNSTKVTVTEPNQNSEVKTINVSPPKAKIVVGKSRTFIATAYDQFNQMISAIFTWSSSNTTVGTIDNTGKFTALSAGTTTITATNGTISGSSYVNVKALSSEKKHEENEEDEHDEDRHKEDKHIEKEKKVSKHEDKEHETETEIEDD